MALPNKASWLFTIWAVCAVSLGSALMSFHQPFRAPAQTPEAHRRLLALVSSNHRWRALHILSVSCGCSQRVMQHLLTRHPLSGATDQVLILDNPAYTALPESPALLVALQQQGFSITHMAQDAIPPTLGLHAVPLLVLVSPEDKIAYIGGYGPHADADLSLLAQVRAGHTPTPLPILGCALSSALAHQLDPLHLKP